MSALVEAFSASDLYRLLLTFTSSALLVGVLWLASRVAVLELRNRQLRHFRDEMTSVVQAETHGVITINQAGRVTFANRPARRMLGYDDEILATHFEQLLDPVSLEAAGICLDSSNDWPPGRREVTAIKGDRHRMPVELAVSETRINGAPEKVLFLLDIAEQKAHERDLQRAIESADSANRGKSAFLANMSHEVRTPMAAIMGLADLCLQSGLGQPQRRHIEKLYQTADSLMAMLNDLLDLSKIEAGAMELEVIPMSLDEVLDEVGTVTRQKAFDRNIELIFERAVGVPDNITGDPLRLRQVLINLVSNAIRFTEQGRVELTIASADDRSSLVFSVVDTGCGMSEEQQAIVMQPFVQADSSTSRRFGGTGLGLAISTRLLALMGSELRLESEQGAGSRFYFTLGLVNSTPIEPGLMDNPMLEGLSALVIDDDPRQREIIISCLASWGIHAEFEASRSGALARLDHLDEHFDLVLFDDYMPGDISTEKIVEIAGRGVVRELNVIRMVRTEFDQPYYGELITTFLNKPFSPTALRQSIEQALGYAREKSRPRGLVQPGLFTGYRILLAEDNPINQEIACELLDRLGIDVVTAEDGVQALKRFTESAFDCVLMDIHMPELDGYEASRQIRETEQGIRTPIIALTASAMIDTSSKAQNAGMDDVIEKPIDSAKLIKVLTNALETGDRASEEVQASEAIIGNLPYKSEPVDVAHGLRNVNDNRRLYRKLLIDFKTQHADDPMRIRDAVRDDPEQAVGLIHTFKGLARTLGATRLANLARSVETGLQNCEHVDTLIGAMAEEMRRVCDSDSVSEQTPVHKPGAESCDLSELRHRLESFDSSAEQCFNQLRPVLDNAGIKGTASLHEMICNYDFDAALEQLGEMEVQLDSPGHVEPQATGALGS